MKITWRTEWPQWLLIAAQFAVAGLTWNSAPDRFPMHWGLDGQVNRYGDSHWSKLVPALAARTGARQLKPA